MTGVFNNLSPIPTGPTETPLSEVETLATKSRKRQQEILRNNPVNGALAPFPAERAPGTFQNLLGSGETLAQPQGVEGVTNVNTGTGSRTAPSNQPQTPSEVLEDLPPTSAPTRLEPQPLDTPYTDLTPTQRNSALRARGVTVGDYAVNQEGQAHRTETGALVLSVEAGGRDRMFLAEDGIGAHSATFQIMQRLGLGAVPQDSTRDLGYTVAWTVPQGREQQFLSAMAELKPSDVQLQNGQYHITFAPHHGLNRTFMSAPFGASKPLSNYGRADV